MKPISIVLLAVALSVAASATTAVLLAPTPVEGAVQHEEPVAPDLSELEGRLAAQESLLRDLSAKLDLRAPTASPSPRQEDLETVVRRVLRKERERELEEAVTADAEIQAFDTEREFERLRELQRSGASGREVAAFWNKIRERGHMDAVVAEFEAWAAQNPQDVDAQIELGNAYLERLQDATTGPEMGEWAMKADGAFDRALDLDETNWEARFSKAVSLSFWPPIFGKQGEAISQFEILLEQQAQAPPDPDHAQTYMFLGNLYQQQGDAERALEIWQQGYAAFPDDAELAERISSANGG